MGQRAESLSCSKWKLSLQLVGFLCSKVLISAASLLEIREIWTSLLAPLSGGIGKTGCLERVSACWLSFPTLWIMSISLMPLPQGRRKQFYIGQAESPYTFQCMENVATHRHTGYLYCAKHNQHAWHANAWGSGGIPPGNFEKQVLWDWIWGHFRT